MAWTALAPRRMSTAAPLVEVTRDEKDQRIAILTLNNPTKLNALGEDMAAEFAAAIRDLVAQPSDALRAVVVTGRGRAFSAGGDVAFLKARVGGYRIEPQATRGDVNSLAMLRFYNSFLDIRNIPVPLIAAVNGTAVGAGLAVALATDIRVVSRTASLGVNFSRLGIHPGMGTTHFLPLLLGPQAAAHMLLTGEPIDGVTAERIGLAWRAVDPSEVLSQALLIARSIASASPLAVRMTVKTLRAQTSEGLQSALLREADAQAQCYTAPDLAAALAALQARPSTKP